VMDLLSKFAPGNSSRILMKLRENLSLHLSSIELLVGSMAQLMRKTDNTPPRGTSDWFKHAASVSSVKGADVKADEALVSSCCKLSLLSCTSSACLSQGILHALYIAQREDSITSVEYNDDLTAVCQLERFVVSALDEISMQLIAAASTASVASTGRLSHVFSCFGESHFAFHSLLKLLLLRKSRNVASFAAPFDDIRGYNLIGELSLLQSSSLETEIKHIQDALRHMLSAGCWELGAELAAYFKKNASVRAILENGPRIGPETVPQHLRTASHIPDPNTKRLASFQAELGRVIDQFKVNE
jgi:hypothetical protein